MENEAQRQIKMKDGTVCRPLYIQNIALSDWELLEKIKLQHNMTTADAVRFSIRKMAGVL